MDLISTHSGFWIIFHSFKENEFTKLDDSDSETDDDYACSEYTTADEDSVSLTDSEQSDTE